MEEGDEPPALGSVWWSAVVEKGRQHASALLCGALCLVLTLDVLCYVPSDNAWHTNSISALSALFTPDAEDAESEMPSLTHDFYEVDDLVSFMNTTYLSWDDIGDDATGTYFYDFDSATGHRVHPSMKVTLKLEGTYRDLLNDPSASLATFTVDCPLSRTNPFGPFQSHANSMPAKPAKLSMYAGDTNKHVSSRRRGRARLLRRPMFDIAKLGEGAQRRRMQREVNLGRQAIASDNVCDGVDDVFAKVQSAEVTFAVRSIRVSNSLGLPSCHHWELRQKYDFSARTGSIQFSLQYSTSECGLDVDRMSVAGSGYCWLNIVTLIVAVIDAVIFVLAACRQPVEDSQFLLPVGAPPRAAPQPEQPASPRSCGDVGEEDRGTVEGMCEVADSLGQWWPAVVVGREGGKYQVQLRLAEGISTDRTVHPRDIRPMGALPLTERGCEARDVDGRWWPVTVVSRSGDGTYRVRVHDRSDGGAGTFWKVAHSANIREAEAEPLRGPLTSYEEESVGGVSGGVEPDHDWDVVSAAQSRSRGSNVTVQQRQQREEAAFQAVIDKAERVGNFRLCFVILTDGLAIVSAALNLRNAVRGGDISAELISIQGIIAGFAVFCAWLSALAHLGAWPRFYLLIQTLQRGAPNAIRFFAGCFPIFMGYALLGTVLFGSYADRFATLDASFVTLFSVMNGDVIDDTFCAIFFEGNYFLEVFSRAYLYSFIAVFIYCVLNVFLAVMEDAYFLCKRRLILDLQEFEQDYDQM